MHIKFGENLKMRCLLKIKQQNFIHENWVQYPENYFLILMNNHLVCKYNLKETEGFDDCHGIIRMELLVALLNSCW